MYGLKQAGIIANDELIKHLKPYGYHPVKFTPGLWKHTDNDTILSLVVDGFAIKYTSMEKANYLFNALKDKYTISIDWDASLYIGISLEWDYNKRTVNLSMPNYVKNALTKFQHTLPNSPEYASYEHTPPAYGANYNTRWNMKQATF